MDSTSVTVKGQVTIPKEIRQKLGIRAGSRIKFELLGDRVELRVEHTPGADVKSGFGMVKSRRKAVPADFDVASLLRK